jgi:hypothetical protein
LIYAKLATPSFNVFANPLPLGYVRLILLIALGFKRFGVAYIRPFAKGYVDRFRYGGTLRKLFEFSSMITVVFIG